MSPSFTASLLAVAVYNAVTLIGILACALSGVHAPEPSVFFSVWLGVGFVVFVGVYSICERTHKNG